MSKYTIKVGIIGGSGLEDPGNQILKSCTVIKCEDAANDFGLPSSDLFQGQIAGIDVVLISRHKPGHKLSPSMINYRANIEALRLAGCTHVLAVTACGSLTEDISKGQLVIPDTFIDRTIHRKNTLYDGTSSKYQGICHIAMHPSFDPEVSNVLEHAATELNIPIRKGATVVTIEGPRFSSRAESKMFQSWGGHLVNMTLCPEVYLAKEAGLLYASIAMATDYDCWKTNEESVCAADVIVLFKKNIIKVIQLLIKAVEMIGHKNWDNNIDTLQNLIKNSNASEAH